MGYLTLCEYVEFFGKAPDDFDNLEWEASRVLDRFTTGVDGYRKLRNAFPTDEEAVECVKRCEGRLIALMAEIKTATANIGLISASDGTVHSKVVASVSAGNETISYQNPSNVKTEVSAAAEKSAARYALLYSTVSEYLSDVKDANGVNLLFMGSYPRWARCTEIQ